MPFSESWLWRRKWQPTPVFLLGRIPQTENPGGVCLCPWGRKESDTTTERLTHTHTHTHTHESWLENLIKNIKMCVFYRQGNWGSERLLNLLKGKLSGREGLELKMQLFWIWEPIFFLLQHPSCQNACHCEIVLVSFILVIWFAKQPIAGLPGWR